MSDCIGFPGFILDVSFSLLKSIIYCLYTQVFIEVVGYMQYSFDLHMLNVDVLLTVELLVCGQVLGL
jgi:hypothetical protein